MSIFHRSPSRDEVDALLTYWDATLAQHPATAMPPAELPAGMASLVRAVNGADATDPNQPAYEDRLLQALLARQKAIAPMTITSATAPALSTPRAPARPVAPTQPAAWVRRNAMPAFEIGLIILLVLASIAGIWLAGNHDDDRLRLAAPTTPVVTPAPEASPGWTHWRGDATRSGTTNSGPVTQPVELWRYDTSSFGFCGPVPAVAGDSVYLACEDGTLHAIARATGEVRWTFTAEPFEPFFNGLTIAGDLAYVLGEDSGALYAVDIATGEERWRYAAASPTAPPAVAGGMAVVSTAEGFLIGLDAATGEERWRTTITTGGRAGDAALFDGMAYAGSETGDLSAVDAATGEIVWQVDTGDHRNASAVVADGIVYVGAGSPDGSLSAYDAETGALRWQRDEPLLTPSVANGVGYSGSSDGTVYAFDAATGEDLWQIQVGVYANPVAIAGDIIYVPSEGDQAVYALDAATGDELWHITVDGAPTYQAAVVDGAIYVVTANGVIQAFAEPAPGIASPEATPATPVSSPVATP